MGGGGLFLSLYVLRSVDRPHKREEERHTLDWLAIILGAMGNSLLNSTHKCKLRSPGTLTGKMVTLIITNIVL